MKTRLHLLSNALVLLALGWAAAVRANDTELPISRIRGIVSQPVPASATTLIGVPFTPEPTSTRIAINTTAKLTVPNVGIAWTMTALAGNPFTGLDLTVPSHNIVFAGGKMDGHGFPITLNTANTVRFTVPTGISFAGIKGNEFFAVPAWTLGTLLSGGAGLTGAATFDATADEVRVNDVGYYYNTVAAEWQATADNASSNNVIVPNLQGIEIIRKAGSPISLVLNGVVRSGKQVIRRAANQTVVVSNPFMSNLTLLDFAGLLNTSLSVSASDKLIYNGVTYYNNNKVIRVATAGAASSNAVIVTPGTAVKIVPSANRITKVGFPAVANTAKIWLAPEKFVP